MLSVRFSGTKDTEVGAKPAETYLVYLQWFSRFMGRRNTKLMARKQPICAGRVMKTARGNG